MKKTLPGRKVNKLTTEISNNTPETKINLQPNSSKVDWSLQRPPGCVFYKEFSKETAIFRGLIFLRIRVESKETKRKYKGNERKIKENKRKIKGIRKHKKGNGRKSKENGKEIKGKIKDLKGKLKKMKGKMKGDGCCEIIFPEKKLNKRKTKISNNAPKRKLFFKETVVRVFNYNSCASFHV